MGSVTFGSLCTSSGFFACHVGISNIQNSSDKETTKLNWGFRIMSLSYQMKIVIKFNKSKIKSLQVYGIA
jgi:tRNA splicing ligase